MSEPVLCISAQHAIDQYCNGEALFFVKSFFGRALIRIYNI